MTIGVSIFSAKGSFVTGITYNGAAMTLQDVRMAPSGPLRIEIWTLLNPDIGTNPVVVNISNPVDSCANAVGLNGVNQNVQIEAIVDNAGINGITPIDPNLSITTLTDRGWVISCLSSNDPNQPSSNQTARAIATGFIGSGGIDTFGPQSPPGTVNISWTGVGGLRTWCLAAISIVSSCFPPGSSQVPSVSSSPASSKSSVLSSVKSSIVPSSSSVISSPSGVSSIQPISSPSSSKASSSSVVSIASSARSSSSSIRNIGAIVVHYLDFIYHNKNVMGVKSTVIHQVAFP